MSDVVIPMPTDIAVIRARLAQASHDERAAWLADDRESEDACARLIDQLLTQWRRLTCGCPGCSHCETP